MLVMPTARARMKFMRVGSFLETTKVAAATVAEKTRPALERVATLSKNVYETAATTASNVTRRFSSFDATTNETQNEEASKTQTNDDIEPIGEI